MIRIIDFTASLLGLIILSPLFLLIAIWIKLDDRKGPVFYKQTRVGKDGVDFGLYKFRSMYVGSDKQGLITIGGRDRRITRSGYYIRKFKLDELPQLINVIKGDMSLVGPRPEVRKYVDLYTEEQRHVLDVRPGITDYASIEYLDENTLLALSDDPDKTYIEEIMPAKIRLNMKYIRNQSLKEYLYVILMTVTGISFEKLVNWYFNKASLPYWGVLVMDIIAAVSACVFAYIFVNGQEETTVHFWRVLLAILVYVPPFCITGKIFHAYEIQFRYTSMADMQRVTMSMLSGVLIVFFIRSTWDIEKYTWELSSTYILLAGALATLSMMFLRIVIRSIYNSNKMSVNAPPAVVYGSMEDMEVIAHAVQNHLEHPHRVVGFITDTRSNTEHLIMGQPIIHKDENTLKWLINEGIEAVICAPSTSRKIEKEQDFISDLANANIKVMITPMISQMTRDKHGNWKNLKIKRYHVSEEDLLPRKEIEVDMEAIGNLLHGKTVLITGAAGSIGSEMVRQIAIYKPTMMVLIDQAETPLHSIMLTLNEQWPEQKYVTLVTSITKERQMNSLFAKYRPDYVFHAAAYKHVPMMEMSPANAVQNNCIGTRVIADLSVKYEVKKFVMISTDKAVNPTNVMGCSKRICEIYCQSLNAKQTKTQFVTTRFGNVLGSNGSVVNIFKKQIKKGGPVTVTHPDIVRYFMLIPEACKLVLQAGTMGHGGEIYAFDMGEPVRIADLAKRMIELSEEKDVKIEFTGLRDGEKLYEEVMNSEENTIPTSHKKIRVAKVREYDFDEVLREEKELEAISYTYDEMAIVRKMKEMVPEFHSQNSRFAALD